MTPVGVFVLEGEEMTEQEQIGSSVVEARERFYQALSEIALSEQSNEWARKRAAQALYIVNDAPPSEALELGRRLAEKYGW